jgi:hypothetical protein
MRKYVMIIFMAGAIGTAVPAEAQLRDQVPARTAPANVMEDSGTGFLLNRLFSPEHFRIGHSYELSYGSFGGSGLTTGTYTNSMMWHFNSRLAARVDVGFMHTPLGTGNFAQQFGGQDSFGRVYLQNAEVAYRPSDNTVIHFSFRQSPYGAYMRPYGYHSPYGFGHHGASSFNARFGTNTGDGLFWNRDLR